MKNNIILILLIIISSTKVIASDTIKFETKNLEIFNNENLIKAGKGKAYTDQREIEIFGDNFVYNKNLEILTITKNGSANIKSKNIKIKFDKAIFNQNDLTIIAIGNVNIVNELYSYEIETSEALYNNKSDFFSSDKKTKLKNKIGDVFITEKFSLDINKNLLKAINLEYIDVNNNNFQTPIAFVNLNSGKLFGKDISLDLSSSISDKRNDPRFKGRSFKNDKNFTEIKKGKFTICEKRDGCPPWEISAEKILHDKQKKIIYYDDAVLRVYDIPVMYFPKFFHPDPSVKRQSGFLSPTFNSSSNTGDYLNTPYFLAIADNKDATFSPRFFNEDKIMIQTEYRHLNKNSSHFVDFSFLEADKKKSKNHFFYNFEKETTFKNFFDSLINLKIEKVSNDNYLEKDNINSKIITNNNLLENSLNIKLNSEDLLLNLNTTVYENLDKSRSDRFEYIYPNIDIFKKFNNKTSLNGEFSLNSSNYIRNYNTNIFESVNANNLIFNSYPLITKNGFTNDYEFIIKNVNSNTKKSENFKEGENIYLSTLLQLNSSLPLLKENDNYKKILNPKIALKLAPNNTQNAKNLNNKIDTNNIYETNRASLNNSTEGGISLTYGADYSIFNLKNSREIFKFKAANNLRFEENNDLPERNQLNDKTSNFFGEIDYNPNEFFNIQYSTAIKNNLKEINDENLITEFKLNKFITNFDYLNSNYRDDKVSYLTSSLTYQINNDNNFKFSTRENKTSDLTEYYNMMYEYKNDCLAASIEYNKNYYSDRDLKPEESLMLKLKIIPINETSSPNLIE
jgi:LPS-assembly protein